MSSCPKCGDELNQDFFFFFLDQIKLSNEVIAVQKIPCPSCGGNISFKKSAHSYYLISGTEVFIGGN